MTPKTPSIVAINKEREETKEKNEKKEKKKQKQLMTTLTYGVPRGKMLPHTHTHWQNVCVCVWDQTDIVIFVEMHSTECKKALAP